MAVAFSVVGDGSATLVAHFGEKPKDGCSRALQFVHERLGGNGTACRAQQAVKLIEIVDVAHGADLDAPACAGATTP